MNLASVKNTGSDPLGRYYTKGVVGKTLVEEMNLNSPKIVVDFGVGDGTLSIEAARIWNKAQFITVDIDDQIKQKEYTKTSLHFTKDVLNSNLHLEIGLNLGVVDAALCNPPYIRTAWRNEFSSILEDAGLSGIATSISDIDANIIFLAQNLRFLRTGGRLGLILPDGILTGEKYRGLRKVLLNNHQIDQVIELPRNIFKKTDAKAHILILTKNIKSDAQVKIRKLVQDKHEPNVLHVPIRVAEKRMDYSYLVENLVTQPKKYFSLGSVCNSIVRGKLSSSDIKKIDSKIFHSSNFPAITANNRSPSVPNEFILTARRAALLNTVVAKTGDILICRVGRNLHEKVCVVPRGFVAISDCVFKISVTENYRQIVLAYLCSPIGRRKLAALAHGVSAKYFSKDDLLSFHIKKPKEGSKIAGGDIDE